MGSFVFKWPYPAKNVHVTGTFDDWGKSEQLDKVGEFWEKEVQLPSADKKYYYKFVVDDDQWVIDKNAPQEEDGHNNTNNVLLPENIKRSTAVTAAPGAFPQTPAAETEPTLSVNPIPASTGIGNPISLPAGETIPDQKEITPNTVDSTVTTSKEDYEKGGSTSFPTAAVVGLTGGAATLAGAGVAAARSVFGIPEKKENLIPESSLPADAPAADTLDQGPTVASAAGANTTTAALAGQVPLEQKRQATVVDPAQVPAAGVPEAVQDSISKSAEGPEAAASAEAVKEKSEVEKELLSKTSPSQTTGEPASAAEAQTSYYGLATAVPETVEKSMEKAKAAPEAAADPAVVAEKTALEKELLKKIPSSEESGEPAPTIAAATSTTAPASTSATTTVTGVGGESVADPTLANEPAVRMMKENEAAATTSTTPAATTAALDAKSQPVGTADVTASELQAANGAPSASAAAASAPAPTSTNATGATGATTLDTKKPGAATAADSSAPSTPASDKKKKHRHRLSAFVKRIFD